MTTVLDRPAPPRTTVAVDITALMENLRDHFGQRLVADALSEATAAYWRRRAETFRWARPVPGEFHGRATREELSERWRELTAIADACEQRARVAELGGEVW